MNTIFWHFRRNLSKQIHQIVIYFHPMPVSRYDNFLMASVITFCDYI